MGLHVKGRGWAGCACSSQQQSGSAGVGPQGVLPAVCAARSVCCPSSVDWARYPVVALSTPPHTHGAGCAAPRAWPGRAILLQPLLPTPLTAQDVLHPERGLAVQISIVNYIPKEVSTKHSLWADNLGRQLQHFEQVVTGAQLSAEARNKVCGGGGRVTEAQLSKARDIVQGGGGRPGTRCGGEGGRLTGYGVFEGGGGGHAACTLHPAPCTLHPVPCAFALHLAPCTCTLHPVPCTLRPVPAPCTLRPAPCTCILSYTLISCMLSLTD